jgi:hypothetical protein
MALVKPQLQERYLSIIEFMGEVIQKQITTTQWVNK